MKATEGGQSLIETILIVPMIVLFIFPTAFAVIHLIYFQIIGKHYLYEFLICRETRYFESSCEYKTRNRFNLTLVGGKLLYLRHQKQENQSCVEAKFQTWYAKEIKIYEKIHLPLQ